MINLESQFIKDYLKDVNTRVALAAEALTWADGNMMLNPLEIIPNYEPNSEGERAWNRLVRQVQSIGVRALKIRRSGAIGPINWGGKNDDVDEHLINLDISRLARKAFKNLFVMGATAVWAYKPEGSDSAKLQVLGGYLEPIYPEDDLGGEVIGIYQILGGGSNPEGRYSYTIRVYDFQANEILEWSDLSNPWAVGTNPDNQYISETMPHLSIYDLDQDGYPSGELLNAVPVLKSELGTDVRVKRVSYSHAFPVWALPPGWEMDGKSGPNIILKGTMPGEALPDRVSPGELDPLFVEQDRILERIRGDLLLPIGSLGGDFPSGEALSQANQSFITASLEYASMESDMFTKAIEDYAALEGLQAVPVTISVNREAMRQIIAQQAREDYKAGVISKGAAAMAVKPYYPDWEDQEFNDWLIEAEQNANSNDLMRAAQSGARVNSTTTSATGNQPPRIP